MMQTKSKTQLTTSPTIFLVIVGQLVVKSSEFLTNKQFGPTSVGPNNLLLLVQLYGNQ